MVLQKRNIRRPLDVADDVAMDSMPVGLPHGESVVHEPMSMPVGDGSLPAASSRSRGAGKPSMFPVPKLDMTLTKPARRQVAIAVYLGAACMNQDLEVLRVGLGAQLGLAPEQFRELAEKAYKTAPAIVRVRSKAPRATVNEEFREAVKRAIKKCNGRASTRQIVELVKADIGRGSAPTIQRVIESLPEEERPLPPPQPQRRMTWALSSPRDGMDAYSLSLPKEVGR